LRSDSKKLETATSFSLGFPPSSAGVEDLSISSALSVAVGSAEAMEPRSCVNHPSSPAVEVPVDAVLVSSPAAGRATHKLSLLASQCPG